MTDITDLTPHLQTGMDLDLTPDDPRALADLVRGSDRCVYPPASQDFPVNGFTGLPERDQWIDRADTAGLMPTHLTALWSATWEAYAKANEASAAARRVEQDRKADEAAVDAGVREAARLGKPAPKAAPIFDFETERRRRTAVAAGLRDAAHEARRAYDEAFAAAGDAWLTEATAALSSRHEDVAEAVETARTLVGQTLARIEVAQELLVSRGGAANTVDRTTLASIEQGFGALATLIASEQSRGVNLADPFMDPPLRIRKMWASSLRIGAPDTAAWELHGIERAESYEVTDLTRGMESLRG